MGCSGARGSHVDSSCFSVTQFLFFCNERSFKEVANGQGNGYGWVCLVRQPHSSRPEVRKETAKCLRANFALLFCGRVGPKREKSPVILSRLPDSLPACLPVSQLKVSTKPAGGRGEQSVMVLAVVLLLWTAAADGLSSIGRNTCWF